MAGVGAAPEISGDLVGTRLAGVKVVLLHQFSHQIKTHGGDLGVVTVSQDGMDPPHPIGPTTQDERRLDVLGNLGPAHSPSGGLAAGPVVEA